MAINILTTIVILGNINDKNPKPTVINKIVVLILPIYFVLGLNFLK